jgi:uncharacterized protein YjbI with pentapeptide repeats
MDDINLGKLRHMISSGRVALLLDGFDELELRVGYQNAADYLQTLITVVTGQAKVILTSRTQHFRSTAQVLDALSGHPRPGARTALGDRIETRADSRVVVVEEFSEEQILRFLTNLYGGDAPRAQARYALIRGIGNLLDLAHNPRMLGFAADLDEERLRDAQDATSKVSAARLYEQIIDQWLDSEMRRQQHRSGLRSITKAERLAACTALALRLWASANPALALQDLSAEVASVLTGLAERGFTEDQAAHTIASGSLLVRTEDGAFTFIHRSVMEWLVAKAAADAFGPAGNEILGRQRMSGPMVAFFADLAGHDVARPWAAATLAIETTEAEDASEAKLNALAVQGHLAASVPAQQNAPAATGDVDKASASGTATIAAAETPAAEDTPEATDGYRFRTDLTGTDLRNMDLSRSDLSGATLRWANLRGMRLDGVDLSRADLSAADLTGAVLTGGSLRDTILTGSKWDRAAILGASGLDGPATANAPELTAAAVARRDPVEVEVVPPSGNVTCVAFSPDGALFAYGEDDVVKIVDADRGRVLRVLRGHHGPVKAVAFSPDGTLIATASNDRTARTWHTRTRTHIATLTGHDGPVRGVAFSPDGTLIATASDDGTTRMWDAGTGTHLATLVALSSGGYATAPRRPVQDRGRPGRRRLVGDQAVPVRAGGA